MITKNKQKIIKSLTIIYKCKSQNSILLNDSRNITIEIEGKLVYVPAIFLERNLINH